MVCNDNNNKGEEIWKIFLHPEKGMLRLSCAFLWKHCEKKFPVIRISGF